MFRFFKRPRKKTNDGFLWENVPEKVLGGARDPGDVPLSKRAIGVGVDRLIFRCILSFSVSIAELKSLVEEKGLRYRGM